MRRYLDYLDSGVEWIGEIPTHWSVQKLKYSSYIKGRIGWQNLRSNEFTDVGPYLITGMHFKNGSVDWNSCYHITEERYEMAPEIPVIDELDLHLHHIWQRTVVQGLTEAFPSCQFIATTLTLHGSILKNIER